MNWSVIRKCVAMLFLALYAGSAAPGSACLLDCLFTGEPATESQSSSDHCNTETSVRTSGAACHSTIETADPALRAEFRSADAGPSAIVDASFPVLKIASRPADALTGQQARAAHGPPGTFLPLRV